MSPGATRPARSVPNVPATGRRLSVRPAIVEDRKDAGSDVDPTLGDVTLREMFDYMMATATHLRPSTRSLYALHGRLYIVCGPWASGRSVRSARRTCVRSSPALFRSNPPRNGSSPAGTTVVLTDDGGDEVARVAFWLREPGAEVKLSTDKPTYQVGEPITVSWTDGPANRWDWIGVYKAEKSDPKVYWYLLWDYTGLHASGTLPPTVTGTLTIGPDSQGSPWPLPPGEYVVNYLLTDRYRSAASTSFEVTD